MAKVVVLDVDGTLMDTNYLHTEAWAQAFEAAGLQVPPRVQIHKLIGKGSDLLVGEFVEDEEAVEKVTELHSEIYGEMQRHGCRYPVRKHLFNRSPSVVTRSGSSPAPRTRSWSSTRSGSSLKAT